MLTDWEWVESESVSLRSWPLIEERDLHFFILRCSVVGSLYLPSEMGITWESLGNHLGITWDLRPSCSPYIGGKLLGDGSLPMQGDFEGLFLFHDAKLLNPELTVAV